MSQVYRCESCKTVIAVGRIESGAIQIKCKRCKHSTLIQPEKKAA